MPAQRKARQGDIAITLMMSPASSAMELGCIGQHFREGEIRSGSRDQGRGGGEGKDIKTIGGLSLSSMYSFDALKCFITPHTYCSNTQLCDSP